MDKRNDGQATVEYVLVLVFFSGAAVLGWQLLYPAISHVYEHFTSRRAEIRGMQP